MAISNFFWLFKVVLYCKKNKFSINQPLYRNHFFEGPKIPVVIKQEKFKYGWRYIAFNKEKNVLIKFPAHYTGFGVYNYLFNL